MISSSSSSLALREAARLAGEAAFLVDELGITTLWASLLS
jgi:hypothetical protein